ncbi:MAG: Gfo/Idh/MocA family protein [Bacteroidia bacterium]
MNKPIRFAVIGTGHIGKRHASMLLRHPEAELVATIDPIKPDSDFHCPHFSSLVDFEKSGIGTEVITVATPNGLHYAHTLAALELSADVVVEKPMGLRSTEVRHMLELAQLRNLRLFPVMQNRYSPPAVWIKSVVDRGLLGQIYMVQLNCFWNRDARYYLPKGWHGDQQLDGGTLFTQFSHFIDMLYWLLGDVKNISGRMHSFNHAGLTDFEDSGMLHFELEGGGMGSFQFSTSVYDANFESSITLIGENGTVKLGGQYMDKVMYCHIRDYSLPELAPTNPGNDYGAYKGSAANHHLLFANVIDVLRGRAAPTTRAEEGLAVVDLIERMYAAMESGY